MLLHYAIRIVEKNPLRNDLTGLTVLDFDLKKPNQGEKFSYPVLISLIKVFGVRCQHFERPLDLPEIVKSYNSQQKEFRCQICSNIYTEIQEFWPHPLYQKILQTFHPQVEKVTILYDILICNLKRSRRRFGGPLTNNNIRRLIGQLLQYDKSQRKNQFFNLLQLDSTFKKVGSIQFQSFCLLDNVNIIMPVRHKNCRHIDAYELTSLITYQKENYQELWPLELQQKESNKYLKCLSQGCQSSFPLTTIHELFSSITFDFEYFDKIKSGYPGNLIYIAKQEGDQILLYDQISISENPGKDDFVRDYWCQNNMEGNNYISYSEFQKKVLDKILVIINQDLHRDIREKLNRYKFGVFKINFENLSKNNKIGYCPARCFNCPIEYQQGAEVQTIRNIDIRTLIAYLIQAQIRAIAENNNTEQVKCPLCNAIFQQGAASVRFSNNLIYYDSQLFYRMQQQIFEIISDPDHVMEYRGNQYLLSDFKNKWKYTLEHYQESIRHYDLNLSTIVFSRVKCPFLNILLKDPLINFKCKNLTRISFQYFYNKFQENRYKMTPAIKLCNCDEEGCQEVSEIDGQLYYDDLFILAYGRGEVHQQYPYGFSYNINNNTVIQLNEQDNAINTRITPPTANQRQHLGQE